MKLTVPPFRAFGWTLAPIVSFFYYDSIIFYVYMSAVILLLILLSTKSFISIKWFLSLSLPFFIPLFFIHGIINPQFEYSYSLFFIPIRAEGLQFAGLISARLSLFISVALGWWHVDRDYFIDWLIARKIPTSFISLVSQATSIVPLIERRGKAVLRAQTARGIPTGPMFRHRLLAIPSILLPVISSLLNEADERSYSLWSRGFNQFKFYPKKMPICSLLDLFYIVPAFTIPLILILIWH